MDDTRNTRVTENDNILPDTLVVPVKYCALMYNIIHVITKRGGINPDEFVVVGELVEFLNTKLKIDKQIANQNAAMAAH
jgi:hypothetical protein